MLFAKKLQENESGTDEKNYTSLKKVFITTLGCPMRLLEAEKIKHYFLQNGYSFVSEMSMADILIISACSVGDKVAQNTSSEINKAIALSKKIIITGCISIEQLKQITINFSDYKYLHPMEMWKIDQFFPVNKILWKNIPENYFFSENNLCKDHYSLSKATYSIRPSSIRHWFRQISLKNDMKKFGIWLNKNKLKNETCFITLNIGCTFNCTFCNTKNCITGIKSKLRKEIVTEYTQLIKNGFRQFVFISEDIGSYGTDTGDNLPDLLNHLADLHSDCKVKWQLDGLNPFWIVKYEESFLSIIKKGCIQTITCPVQSGSSQVLQQMKRYHNPDHLVEIFQKFRKANKLLRFFGIFMIGFPSETSDDFNQTLAFIKKVRFDEVAFSIYSEFQTCASSKIEPKLSEDIKIERLNFAKKFLKKHNIIVKY